MATPVAAEVLAFLGKDETQPTEQVDAHLSVVTEMVRAYTRGVGFDETGAPDAGLAAVIISSTARLVSNPTMQSFMSIDDASFRPGSFAGWTLPEIAVLHAYRRRAH